MTERKTTLCIKNAPTLASCCLDHYGLIFVTIGNDMHIQLDLHFHFYLFYFPLNSCDGKEAKQRVFLGRLLVALKRAGCVVC